MSEKFIARGAEKKVYENPHNPEQVVKVYGRESSSLLEVKARFYIGKLLHTLLPSILPDTHQSSQVGDKEMSYSTPKEAVLITDKVSRDPVHIRINELSGQRREHPLTDEETAELDSLEAQQTERSIGLEAINHFTALGVQFDRQIRNFAVDENGNEVYLDSIDPWTIEYPMSSDDGFDFRSPKQLKLNLDIEKIHEAIDNLSDEYAKRKAREYLERFEALAEEERVEKNSSAWYS